MIVYIIFQENMIGWLVRLSFQRHISFFWRIVAFLGITFFASCYQISPGMSATSRTGHNVIQREVALGATVLAFEIVALEYILPGKINPLKGGCNVSI